MERLRSVISANLFWHLAHDIVWMMVGARVASWWRNRKLKRGKKYELETAAMQLCCVLSTTHSMECACEACQAACEAVPYLPTMSAFYKAQFERRIAVQAVAKEQREKGNRYER
jgi:hypothetical protein